MLGHIMATGDIENWSPLSVIDKGKGKMNATQAFSPVGLKVLVVDDNQVCLAVLKKMLESCSYSVTPCNSAAKALSLIQGKDIAFDLVLCDVHMPGMDGFKLLKLISLERDLPVIMMSSDDETDVVMKGITQGACDYFLKPVRLQRLQTIWQHVFRRREMGDVSGRDGDSPDGSDPSRGSKFRNERDNSRKRKGKEEAVDDLAELPNVNKKKTRLVWTQNLHKQFVDAVKNLGTANAVPKQILEKMNVKGISRENVASHLQKYRKYLTDQEAASGDEKDLNGAVNRHSHPFDPYQMLESFSGSIEIQPGAINAPPFTLSSLHSPPPPPAPSQNFTPQTFSTPQTYNNSTTLQPFAGAPGPGPQSFSTPAQSFSSQNFSAPPQNFTPSQTSSITAGFNSNLSTELYPIPSQQQSFPVLEDGNFRLGGADSESLAIPVLDVASSSNFTQRLRQFQGLGEVVRPGLVQSAFYNNNLDYQS